MLTQSEADILIAMLKKRGSDQSFNFPCLGDQPLTIPIISLVPIYAFM